jgi:hypothetical protein
MRTQDPGWKKFGSGINIRNTVRNIILNKCQKKKRN